MSRQGDIERVSDRLPEEQVNRDELPASPISRRMLFDPTRAAQLLSLWVLGGCVPEELKSRTQSEGPTRVRVPTDPPPLEGGDDDAGEGDPPVEVCNANRIPLAQLDRAGEPFDPKIKIYGRNQNAMFAIWLPKYAYGNLARIYLLDGEGNILVHKVITDADVRPDLRLRYVVFENLRFDDSFTSGHIVFELSSGQFLKRQLDGDQLKFEQHFRGGKVFTLGHGDFIPGSDIHQSFVNFGPQEWPTPGGGNSQFLGFDAYEERPDQYIYTAQEDAVFRPAPGLKGAIVTDIMGNVLAEDGETIRAATEHEFLIGYRRVGQNYYRNIMRIG